MILTWEEQRDALCEKIENNFDLQKFSNRNFPIIALTSNDIISQNADFKNNMRLDGKKDLAAIGDIVIDFLIMEHFLDKKDQKSAQVQNVLREKHGKNRTLHQIAKTSSVNLNDYIIKTKNERCAETGKTCLAVYFEALVAIIFIENGLPAAEKFFRTISFFEHVREMNEIN
jgi:dsRNA-specific ribonuclease